MSTFKISVSFNFEPVQQGGELPDMLASLPMCVHLQIDFCACVIQRSGTGRISASGECGHCLIEHTKFTIGRVLVQIDFGVVTCMFMFVCKAEVEACLCVDARPCACVCLYLCVCVCVPCEVPFLLCVSFSVAVAVAVAVSVTLACTL